MKLTFIERWIYWSYRRVLNGYARIFASGLFHLEARQNKFESEVKQVADTMTHSIAVLDARLRAIETASLGSAQQMAESKGGQ